MVNATFLVTISFKNILFVKLILFGNLRGSVHFGTYGYELLIKKLFTGFIYFSQYTTKVMFHTKEFSSYRFLRKF
jgi:hypothetical protein